MNAPHPAPLIAPQLETEVGVFHQLSNQIIQTRFVVVCFEGVAFRYLDTEKIFQKHVKLVLD